VCTPGPWIADECPGGVDPGAHYVRFSMVPSQADTRRACEALRTHRKTLLGG